jgi:hypothetical protein
MIKAFLCAATLVTASVAAAMANDDGANVKLVYDQPQMMFVQKLNRPCEKSG